MREADKEKHRERYKQSVWGKASEPNPPAAEIIDCWHCKGTGNTREIIGGMDPCHFCSGTGKVPKI